ncbi:MAG: hypothetical protein JWM41_3563 [Gemmatimonadetes bacterium]|jgi:hypothetical protein|nr:hypothetical protein [Gemmatimonadota bacterium]
MAQLTHEQYDILERAVLNGTRVILRRKGRRENIVIPLTLRVIDGREVVEARNPTTGHDLKVFLDELDSIELVK